MEYIGIIWRSCVVCSGDTFESGATLFPSHAGVTDSSPGYTENLIQSDLEQR